MNIRSVDANTSVTHDGLRQKQFSRAIADAFPLSVSVFTYGVAYGALAHTTNHLSLVQTLAMSVIVFAGASQFTVLALLHQSAAVWAIVCSAFLLNARQVLYGLSLGPYVRHLSKRKLAVLAHGLTDESYSVAIVAAQSRTISAGYFAGAGSAVFVPWFISSALGFLLGGYIADPEKYGLDFAYIGAFLGLLVAQITSLNRLFATLAAASAAILTAKWCGTSGAVLAGAAISFLFGYFAKAPEPVPQQGGDQQ